LQEKKLEEKILPYWQMIFFVDLAQDLLICHFGSFRAKSAILAVGPPFVILAAFIRPDWL
jgi:hypothetical protein